MNEGSRECQRCDNHVNETVEYVVLGCSKYAEERMVLAELVENELGCQWNDFTVNVDECMIVLTGLNEEVNEKVVEGVKVFLEKLWEIRGRNA